MKGRIIIEVDDAGTHFVDTMTDLVRTDRVFLVHALGRLLGLELLDYQVLMLAEHEGVLNEAVTQPITVSVDMTELEKQLQEEE